jgi:hypothetical protein
LLVLSSTPGVAANCATHQAKDGGALGQLEQSTHKLALGYRRLRKAVPGEWLRRKYLGADDRRIGHYKQEPIGKQDQYIAAYGGITCFRFLPNGQVEAWPLKISQRTLYDMEDHLLLFFTGYTRSAGEILKEQDVKSIIAGQGETRNWLRVSKFVNDAIPKPDEIVPLDGKDWKASEWVKTQLGPLCRRKTTVDGKEQWYFTKSIRIPGVRHTVRITVLWKRQRDAEPRKILITNRTYWEVHRILKTYRKRWTGTETFHRDGKQHLGMGDCQLRSGESQTRHMYLVFLAYSALMTQLRHDRAQEWAQTRLTTIGESCRAMFRETLGKTIAWVVEQVAQGQSLPEIKAHLALP